MLSPRHRVMAFVMAGGKGSRLEPLTLERSKPAVPFGGKYRIIDFVLSNLINSGVYSVYVMTQFKSQSLTQHLHESWTFGSIIPGQFVHPVPAQQRLGDHWYLGTADCIYQNIHLVREHRPDVVAIFGGDHIFLMDVHQMVTFSLNNDADVAIACIPFPISEAHQFGVIQVDDRWRIFGFQEKPRDPTPMPGRPDMALVSMGNYIFRPEVLRESLRHDAEDERSTHDFDKDVLPRLLAEGKRLFAYDFNQNVIPNSPADANDAYWRDVGTLDAYYAASMDLRAVRPELDLYNPSWPIRSSPTSLPPAKFVHNAEGRVGQAVQSVVCEGTIISGATVSDSLIGRGCRINSFAEISQSVLMDDVTVGRGAKLHRCIVDKHVTVPPGMKIGFDAEADKKLFNVTPEGIVVIAKNRVITAS